MTNIVGERHEISFNFRVYLLTAGNCHRVIRP